MKTINILLGSLLLTLWSCGAKKETSKTTFRVFASSITAGNASAGAFPGGILLLGRREDGAQSFSLSYESALELEIAKGKWEFATIGWDNSAQQGPMTGGHKCSYQKVDVTGDQTITFSMTANQCMQIGTLDGKFFSEKKFMNLSAGQFKKMRFKSCGLINGNSCSGPGTWAQSYKVEIPAKLKGLVVNGPKGLTSICMDTQGNEDYFSELTLPAGGFNGVVSVKLTSYTNSGCVNATDTRSIFLEKGPANGFNLNIDGFPVKALLSPTDALELVGKNLNYKGILTSGSLPPTPTDGDTYLIQVANIYSPIVVTINNYAYYWEGNWYSQSGSAVSLVEVEGKTYINYSSAYTTFFLQFYYYN